MSLKARLSVQSVTDYGNYQSVHLTAVHSNDPASPNYSFSKFTPSAELKLTVTNPDAFGFFVAGQSYDLEFTSLAAVAAPASEPVSEPATTTVASDAPVASTETTPAPAAPEPAAETAPAPQAQEQASEPAPASVPEAAAPAPAAPTA